MKKYTLIVMIASLFIIICLISGCSLLDMFYSPTVAKTFNEKYDSKNLAEFCDDMSVYKMEVMMPREGKSILLLLANNGIDTYEGTLSLRIFRDNRYKTIESYPVEVVEDSLWIHDDTNKIIKLESLFFYQFDVSKYEIKNAYEDVDGPRHVVDGNVDNETMKQYMSYFYDEFILCLKEFDSKDLYFSALDHLYANQYNDNIGTYRSFSFAFDEGQKTSDLPSCIYPEAELVFTESCSRF